MPLMITWCLDCFKRL